MAKEIELSPEQWRDLKRIVSQGAHAERRMTAPIEIVNGDVSIDIKADEIKIILLDN